MIIFCTRHLPNFPNLSISVNLHKVELLHSSSYWTITFHFDQTIPIWSCKLTPQVHFVWFYIDCVLIMKLHFRLCSLPFYSEWLYWLLAESKGNLPSEKHSLHTLSPAVSLQERLNPKSKHLWSDQISPPCKRCFCRIERVTIIIMCILVVSYRGCISSGFFSVLLARMCMVSPSSLVTTIGHPLLVSSA